MSGHGLKICSAHSRDAVFRFSHSHTSHEQVHAVLTPPSFLHTAKAAVFMKTLALFCSLKEHGCSFITSPKYARVGTGADESSDSELEIETDVLNRSHPPGTSVLVKRSRRSRRKKADESENKCRGQLVMRRDDYNRYFIVYVFLSSRADHY